MEIESTNAIQDTIHNLYTLSISEPVPYQRLLSSAQNLVNLFNDLELSAAVARLSPSDYQAFLLTHLILLDTVNARFLWKRIPKSFKSDGADC